MRYQEKSHSVIIKVNTNPNEPKFVLEAMEPLLEFSSEMYQYLNSGDLKTFLEICKDKLYEYYEH